MQGKMGHPPLVRVLVLALLGLGLEIALPSASRAGSLVTQKERMAVRSAVSEAQDGFETGRVTDQYYTQLTREEKQAYAVLAGADLKTGSAQWLLGKSFSVPEETASDSQALKESEPIRKLFAIGERALYAFRLDNMYSVYWMYDCNIDVNWSVSSRGDGTALVTVNYVAFEPIPYYSGVLRDDSAVQEAVQEAAKAIASQRKNSSRAETVRAMVAFMAERFSYGNTKTHQSHTPAGVLLSKYGRTGTCEGYARVFYMLAKRLGIPVVYVESRTHAYNYVQMENGGWYGVDATWADAGGNLDESWILFGQEDAARNDRGQAHEAYLSRYGARLAALSIAGSSYGRNR